MTRKYLEDGETFTDEWKAVCLTHPVISGVFLPLVQSRDRAAPEGEAPVETARKVGLELFQHVGQAAVAFAGLGQEAYNEAEPVQDGLFLVTLAFHQFYPAANELHSLSGFYRDVNRVFWGNYFYQLGQQAAVEQGAEDEVFVWEQARALAERFWKFGQDEFLPTIALGVEFVDERLADVQQQALLASAERPGDGHLQ